MTNEAYNKDNGQSKYILNSFQTPNAVVDELMPYLTPNEMVVLLYTIRHILGWTTRITHRRHNISLDAFEDGYTANENHVTYPGCGLSRDAIITALAGLTDHGVLTKGPRTAHGQIYEISFDRSLDLDKLKTRLSHKAEQNRKKTANARKLNPQITGKSVPQTNGKSVPQTNGKSVPQTNGKSVPQTNVSLSDRPNRNPSNSVKHNESYIDGSSIESPARDLLSQKQKSISEILREKGVGGRTGS